MGIVDDSQIGQVVKLSPLLLSQDEMLFPDIAEIVGLDSHLSSMINIVSCVEANIEKDTPLSQTVSVGKLTSFRQEEQNPNPLLDLLNMEGVPQNGRDMLTALIQEFEDVFVAGVYSLGFTNVLMHEIDTGDSPL
jgi:hypothetical protein